LLDSCIPGHGGELAPVVGHGITEDRDHEPPVTNPHGMSIERGRIPAGGQIGQHLLHEKQVMIVFSGSVEVMQNEDAEVVSQTVDAQDLYSFPAGSWRSIHNGGKDAAEFVLMTAGDHKKNIVWSDTVRSEAARLGFALDHNGYVAPLALLPQEVRDYFAAQ
jgi:mannose-6-phosphate isomerase-like protein (cupin superfamily)